MQNERCFDIATSGKDQLFIRLVSEPGDIYSSMNLFFREHAQTLRSLKSQKSTRALIDITLLDSISVAVLYAPQMISHFIKMTPLSNQKLIACAVCVSSKTVADFIQTCINTNPGEVPTFVSASMVDCKKFLKQYVPPIISTD